jgi:hypothetical protein
MNEGRVPRCATADAAVEMDSCPLGIAVNMNSCNLRIALAAASAAAGHHMSRHRQDRRKMATGNRPKKN